MGDSTFPTACLAPRLTTLFLISSTLSPIYRSNNFSENEYYEYITTVSARYQYQYHCIPTYMYTTYLVHGQQVVEDALQLVLLHAPVLWREKADGKTS